MQRNNATKDGGTFLVTKSNFFVVVPASSITMTGLTDVYESKANWGGFMNIDNDQVSVYISKSIFRDFKANKRGGFMSIVNAASISVIDTTLTDSYSPDTHGIYSVA
jgi:hypothetical protein